MTIKDKVAIITGASSGIGYATALALSKAGAKVAIGARRTDKLDHLKMKLRRMAERYYLKNLTLQKELIVMPLLAKP